MTATRWTVSIRGIVLGGMLLSAGCCLAAAPTPRLTGPLAQAALPADLRVCPGSPVVLTVGVDPPMSTGAGAAATIRFEIVQGAGWFGSIEKMETAPRGPFGILLGRIRARMGSDQATSNLDPELGSTAVVFHPLGKEGDTVKVRASGVGEAAGLGSVDFSFSVGHNQEHLLSRLAEQGINIEARIDAAKYEMDEYMDSRNAGERGSWRITIKRLHYLMLDGQMIRRPIGVTDDPEKVTRREPFDRKNNPYIRCRYWGETPSAIVGCLLDPDPPGPDGHLGLYFFDKATGLMKEFRFYGRRGCGWTSFQWNMDTGGGFPFTVQITRRAWEPPTKPLEIVDIFRQNIHLLPDSFSVGPTPTPYDPNRDEPAEAP